MERRQGIECQLALMSLHFERLIKQSPDMELHFTLKRYPDATLTMSFDGREYPFPADWYEHDPRDCINAFVKYELTALGRTDLLERFTGL
jgi:hypothetical protein